MTVEYLRQLLVDLSAKTVELGKALDECDEAAHNLNVKKSSVKKLTMLRDEIREAIMAEKVLIKEIK